MREWSVKRLYKHSVSFRWEARFFILSVIIAVIIALVWGAKNLHIRNFVLSMFQKGGITAGEVKIGQSDRELYEETKDNLKRFLPNDKTREIIIKITYQDAETLRFAHKIKDYLISLGYINTTVFGDFLLTHEDFFLYEGLKRDIKLILDEKDDTVREIYVAPMQ